MYIKNYRNNNNNPATYLNFGYVVHNINAFIPVISVKYTLVYCCYDKGLRHKSFYFEWFDFDFELVT